MGEDRRATDHILEVLEDRSLLAVNLLHHYTGLNFSQGGGFVPPDSNGAAGPTNYVETVNQTLAIYSPKATKASSVTDSFSHFWYTVGGLPKVSNLSDPIVTYDDQIGRFRKKLQQG